MAVDTKKADARTDGDSDTASLVVDVHTPGGGTDGTVELPAELFGVQSNVPLMHQVVVAQMAAARQGTHKVKTRAEVSGGGRKPYRQKGTGRARQGSTRAPQFAGGGVSHGPVPRSYAQRTPKKMIAAALRGALSDRARSARVHVVSELVAEGSPSTKGARELLGVLSLRTRFLLVLERTDAAAWKSAANLPGVHPIAPDQLNTYDVLASDDVVFTRTSLATYVAGPQRGRSVTASARSGELDADVVKEESK
ncbi:MAG: 50S ribosomal protein L4 [Mycobacteriaceae bacterium]